MNFFLCVIGRKDERLSEPSTTGIIQDQWLPSKIHQKRNTTNNSETQENPPNLAMKKIAEFGNPI